MSRSTVDAVVPVPVGLAGRVISGVEDVEHIRAEPQPEVRRDLFDHDKITGTVLPGEPFAAVIADDIDRGFLGQTRKPHQGPLPVVHRATGLDRGRPPALGQVVTYAIGAIEGVGPQLFLGRRLRDRAGAVPSGPRPNNTRLLGRRRRSGATAAPPLKIRFSTTPGASAAPSASGRANSRNG